jgi:hypothetical protein
MAAGPPRRTPGTLPVQASGLVGRAAELARPGSSGFPAAVP